MTLIFLSFASAYHVWDHCHCTSTPRVLATARVSYVLMGHSDLLLQLIYKPIPEGTLHFNFSKYPWYTVVVYLAL